MEISLQITSMTSAVAKLQGCSYSKVVDIPQKTHEITVVNAELSIGTLSGYFAIFISSSGLISAILRSE